MPQTTQPVPKGKPKPRKRLNVQAHDAEPMAPVHQATSGPPARANGWLVRIDNLFIRIDKLIHRAIPEKLNPLTHSGAVANTAFLVALVSGIALLLWYSPSVHHAYASLEAARESSWLGQWVRSLHRYSSDAFIFFVLVHAMRIVAAKRFFGARWLAWVTGTGLLGIAWLLGWTGYWLVWDVRAQHIADGSARFLDVLPIFGEPLASSFLTNDSVPSLLFFLVFFAHMLLPLAIGIGLWLHLSRVSRAKILTSRPLTAWIVATLFVLAAIVPATSADPADMSAVSDGFSMDWWYLWPIALADRLTGGALWGVFLFGTTAFVSAPWWMKKRTSSPIGKAAVNLDACNGCTLCSKDCPFDAITMVPRTDGKRIPVQAEVDLDRCVGCGICTGACDSDAISLPWLEIRQVKEQLNEWVDDKLDQSKRPLLAFLCSSSAGASFQVNKATGDCPALPGFQVKAVPCAGWVSPLLLEHCLQRGAEGILVAGCGPGDRVFREGAEWLRDRIAGTRRPIFRKRRADVTKVRFVEFDRTRPAELQAAAEEFRRGKAAKERRRSRTTAWSAGIVLASALAGIVVLGSDLSYAPPPRSPSLVISFSHPGELMDAGQVFSAEELERRPVHMRGRIATDRRRAPVRLRVYSGETLLVSQTYKPRGFKSDGPSVALERIPLGAGEHPLRVEIGDTANPDEWNHVWEKTVRIDEGTRRVLLFDSARGFSLE